MADVCNWCGQSHDTTACALPQWERRWADRAGEAGMPPHPPLSATELEMATRLWQHIRWLAAQRPVPPVEDPTSWLADQDKEWPIDPAHYLTGLTVEHTGAFWQVTLYSREFSSSFYAFARGVDLATALSKAEQEG